MNPYEPPQTLEANHTPLLSHLKESMTIIFAFAVIILFSVACGLIAAEVILSIIMGINWFTR